MAPGYPGRRGGRSRKKVAPNRSELQLDGEFERLLASNVQPGRGATPSPQALTNQLLPMHVERSGSPPRSSAQALLDTQEQESSPLLGSRKSVYTPSEQRLPALPKHFTRGTHHVNRVRSARHQSLRHSTVIHGRNPAPDQSLPLFSSGCCCCQCVRTNEVGVVERFGEFQDLQKPGLLCMPWPCTRIASRVTMRIQQLDVLVETKTLDNVFVHLQVVVLFRVQHIYKAHYTLVNVRKQIRSLVLDAVRSTVPRISVDEVFSQTSDIALSILRRLQGLMSTFGYEILDALVTHITPNDLVKDSMNEINASRRIKHAMPHKAEATKVTKIKEAEAACERSYLEGVGVANQRKAIARGLKESILSSQQVIPAKDVMDMLLLSHYMDTLVAIGSDSMVLNHSPGELVELGDQLDTYFVPDTQPASAQLPEIPDLLW